MRDFDALWFVLILLIYSIFPILFIYNRERNRPRPPSSVFHLIRYTPSTCWDVRAIYVLFPVELQSISINLAPCKSAECLLCKFVVIEYPDNTTGESEGHSKHSYDYCSPVSRWHERWDEAGWRPVNPSRCTRWRKVVSQLYFCCSDVGNDTRCGLGRLGERRKQ